MLASPGTTSSASSIVATWRRGHKRRSARTRSCSARGAAAAGRLVCGGCTVVHDGLIGPWFVDIFGRASGITQLHYAVLLPSEPLCLDRIESRVGHGFSDLDAARHMYTDFANADLDSRHLVTVPGGANHVAAHVHQLVQDKSLLRRIRPESIEPA